MIKRTVKLIHDLKVIFFMIIVMSFMFQLGANPIDLGKVVGTKIGKAVGMNVSIPENSINKLALQLKEEKESLDEREAKLNDLEKRIQEKASSELGLVDILLLAGITLLFLLIVFNYYLDYKRKKTRG